MEGWQTQVITASASEAATQWQLTVLLPAYNEQKAIIRVLDEIVESLSDGAIQYEILVVDDASTDRTAELAEQYAHTCWQCPVRVIRCPQRRGAGADDVVGEPDEVLGDAVERLCRQLTGAMAVANVLLALLIRRVARA